MRECLVILIIRLTKKGAPYFHFGSRDPLCTLVSTASLCTRGLAFPDIEYHLAKLNVLLEVNAYYAPHENWKLIYAKSYSDFTVLARPDQENSATITNSLLLVSILTFAF